MVAIYMQHINRSNDCNYIKSTQVTSKQNNGDRGWGGGVGGGGVSIITVSMSQSWHLGKKRDVDPIPF